MTVKPNLKRVLVVLSPDLIAPDKPKESPLIQRAISLAKAVDCELELFHVCYDGSLDTQLFASETDLENQRKALIDRDATLLAEMAARIKDDGVKVRHEVRWDAPRTDAILRKAAQVRPDVVMKQAREHSYILGLSSNTDWDLARRSPAHVWLVSDEIEDINGVMAAVGEKFSDPGEVTTTADFNLLKMARAVGNCFRADVYPVNAYQIPTPQSVGASIGGAIAPAATIDESHRLRTETFKRHSSSIKALAEYFNIDRTNVHICEGHPNTVIPELAKAVNADLIVMGANNMSRLERLVSAVTVEPVMADTAADIFIVREQDRSSVPNTSDRPLYGVPKLDVEAAITCPEKTFDSPQQVANLEEVSFGLRDRILQAWEYDIRSDMTDENEGGRPRDIDVDALDEIFSAKALLKMKREKPGNGQMTLSGMQR